MSRCPSYLHSYVPGVISIPATGAFTPINFAVNGQLQGWVHVAGSPNLICQDSGLYQLSYNVQALINAVGPPDDPPPFLQATMTYQAAIFVNGALVPSTVSVLTVTRLLSLVPTVNCQILSSTTLQAIAASSAVQLRVSFTPESGSIVGPNGAIGTTTNNLGAPVPLGFTPAATVTLIKIA